MEDERRGICYGGLQRGGKDCHLESAMFEIATLKSKGRYGSKSKVKGQRIRSYIVNNKSQCKRLLEREIGLMQGEEMAAVRFTPSPNPIFLAMMPCQS